MSARVELVDLFFPPESVSSFFLFSWRHLESILRVLEEDCSIAFAFALTAFSTASFQKSRSRPRASNWARIEVLRLSRKYQIMISLFRMAARSKSRRTVSSCSRYAAQSRTSSSWCWESLWIFSQ